MFALPLHCGTISCREQDLTQRVLLATWLLEISLAKVNQLEDAAASDGDKEVAENIGVEKSILEEDIKNFLVTYKVEEFSGTKN